jgi:Nuclease-related domain.
MARTEDAEGLVLRALERQSKPGDVILQGVRFTDPKNGDVEADFLVLIPELGVAVIEVKGGLVTYRDGEWQLTGIADPSYKRRIHPVEQARRAKHSLRRYLDRQPEWNLGLVRSSWFVVLPETSVDRDFGPEGLQDHLLGCTQMPGLRAGMAAVLDRGLLTEPRPSPEQIEDAVSLSRSDTQA